MAHDGYNPVTPIVVDETSFFDAQYNAVNLDDAGYSALSGATGVMVLILNTSTLQHTDVKSAEHSAYTLNLDTTANASSRDGAIYSVVGVDSNNQFQVYAETFANIEFHIIGYFGDAAQWHGIDYDTATTSPDDKTPTKGSWQSIDISGDTDGGVAVAGIWALSNQHSSLIRQTGWREASDTSTFVVDFEGPHGMVFGVNGSEQCDMIVENQTDTVMLNLLGFMTDGFTTNSTYDDGFKPGSSSTWEDMTSAGTTSAIACVAYQNSSYSGIRKNGDTTSAQAIQFNTSWSFVVAEADSSGVVETYKDAALNEYSELGYFTEVAGGAAANPKGPLGHPLNGPFRGPI